jgi:hypothetical protein
MPLPVIADVFRCTFEWALPGLPGNLLANNVIHFHAPGNNHTDVFNALSTEATADQVLVMGSNASVENVSIKKLDGPSAPQDFGQLAAWAGNGGAEVIVQGCCVVTLRTALSGRSFRGRVYLPFVAEPRQQDGLIQADQIAIMQGAWTTFIGDMTVNQGVAPCVASYTLVQKNNVIGATVRRPLATQRRRQRQVQRLFS